MTARNGNRSILWILAVIAAVIAPATAPADSVSDEISQLHKQLQALTERLDALEESNRELEAANTRLLQTSRENADNATRAAEQAGRAMTRIEAVSVGDSWADSLRWSGDFRYRFENIDVDGSEDRNRHRVRARATLTADVNDTLEVGLGLATGGADPVSANQTLGGGGSSKDINLDLAYFDWSGLDNTHVLGGKFKNILRPVGKNSMLWDSDWRPEGLAFTISGARFFATGLGTWLESDSNKGSHFAWLAEAGVQLSLGDGVNARLGVGYHEIDTAGRPSFFGDDDFFGNSFLEVDGARVYRYDYHGLQAFGEIGFELFGLPAMAFADYVQNQDADVFDTGYTVGFKLGSAKEPGSWDLSWAWEDLEANAALGLLVDSDFGDGGTDAQGHILKGGYAIHRNFTANISYLINEIDGDLGTERDYNRLQLDLNFKY